MRELASARVHPSSGGPGDSVVTLFVGVIEQHYDLRAVGAADRTEASPACFEALLRRGPWTPVAPTGT
jgi:hypothetical protein